ncbi:MAG: diadenylate cyclase CdaA [Christensenellales bacterium]
MSRLAEFWNHTAQLFASVFFALDIRNIVDILLVTLVIYRMLTMFMHTRANSVLKGVALLLVFMWATETLQLNAINWILRQLLNTGSVLLVVLFQPELRRALDRLGRTGWWKKLIGGQGFVREESEVVREVVQALTDLSKRRIGALIVIERDTGLSDVIESGTMLDAQISAPLIENVFEPNTPLHDGAMVIRGNRIVAAACILQLTEDTSVSRELGTRHRAAIGVSESTDAVALIVSEETGTISVSRGGKLTRYLDAKSLTELLNDLYLPPEEKPVLRIGRKKA